MPGLAGWLAITTSVLVTAAVFTVSAAGVRSLRNFADSAALARVQLAVVTAREALRQGTDDLLIATRVLSERPTLHRLLGSSNPAALASYLARYCEGASLDACGAVDNGKLLASVGAEVDWPIVLARAGEQSQRFLVTGALADTSLFGARARVAERDTVSVYALRRLDRSFAERLSERVGVEIRIEDFASFHPGEGPLAVLNSDALSRSAPVVARIDELDAYAASLPIAAVTGETIALMQAVLPRNDVMGRVARVERRMLLIAIAVALLATIGGVLIGHYWIHGVRRLTDAARRIGSGDLTASIPEERGAEIGVLASTMEEMRRNLVELTDEIRLREAQAQAVLGGIVEGVFAVDQKRRIRFLNAKAEKLLNVSAADAFGRFCGDILKPGYDAEGRRPCEYACPILNAREAGAAEAVEQLEGVAGRFRRVVVASAAASGGIQVQVLRDETEIESVRRTRDTVLANISHEFRTPLAAQLASIELLRDGLGSMSLAAQRDLVASLERGVQRLTWLIDNLLESVRIESGQLSIRRHDLRLEEVVEAARDLIEPLIVQRGQKLELGSIDQLPVIRGDRQRLVQVVVNLLANASKFGPPDSVIRVGGSASDSDSVDLWVDDEGPGPVNPDDVKLFEQFRRSGGEDPEESGLGLGLFIVRSIVERHGGRVSLARTAESRTRAKVHLPMDIIP
jgi:signal transduction histidine kinase/HAMP domain-containing protein